MSILQTIRAWFKGPDAPLPAQGGGAYPGFPHSGMWNGPFGDLLKETRRSIDTSQVDATLSSAFQACLNSYTGAWPAAPLEVQKKSKGGEWEEVVGHPLIECVKSPLNILTEEEMAQATLGDYFCGGNAFQYVLRNARRVPIGLRHLPNWTIRPRWPADGSEWLSAWEYWADATKATQLDPMDVVHFRCGQPDYSWQSLGRLGLSPVRSVLLELFTDDEASAFIATILSNMSYPVLLSPDTNEPVAINAEQREAILAEMRKLSSGARRGNFAMFGLPIKMQSPTWSPKELEFGDITLHLESRIAAVMNVPAAYAGLRVGLINNSQRANQREQREQFKDDGLIPLMRIFAARLTASLLPQFPGSEGMRVVYATDKMPSYQEDQAVFEERLTKRLANGAITRNEWREALGYPPDTARGDYYLLQSTMSEVPANEIPEPPQPAPAMVPTDVPAKMLSAGVRGALKAAEMTDEEIDGVAERLWTAGASRPLKGLLAAGTVDVDHP